MLDLLPEGKNVIVNVLAPVKPAYLIATRDITLNRDFDVSDYNTLYQGWDTPAASLLERGFTVRSKRLTPAQAQTLIGKPVQTPYRTVWFQIAYK